MSPICGHRSEFVASCGARDGLREDGKCWRHTGQPDWVPPVSLGEQLAVRDAEIARVRAALEGAAKRAHLWACQEEFVVAFDSCANASCTEARAALNAAGEKP